MEPVAEFGPFYPNLGVKVARLRKSDNRRAHGKAVLESVNRMNRSALQRELPTFKPLCASGTTHSDGVKILRAIREQHQRSLDGALAADHKRRTDEYVIEAYEAAMSAKRAAL